MAFYGNLNSSFVIAKFAQRNTVFLSPPGKVVSPRAKLAAAKFPSFTIVELVTAHFPGWGDVHPDFQRTVK